MTAQNKNKSAFTLIELLLVIAIIGILAAVVAVAINPAQKINQANDAKAKSDIGQVASAAQSYFTTNQTYPTTALGVNELKTKKELATVPTAPNASYTSYDAYTACATAPCTAFAVYSTLLAPVTASNVWCYRSFTGVAKEDTVANCIP